MTSDFEGFFIPDFIHYMYFHILILEKEPVFLILMFSAFFKRFFIVLIFIQHLTEQYGRWIICNIINY